MKQWLLACVLIAGKLTALCRGFHSKSSSAPRDRYFLRSSKGATSLDAHESSTANSTDAAAELQVLGVPLAAPPQLDEHLANFSANLVGARVMVPMAPPAPAPLPMPFPFPGPSPCPAPAPAPMPDVGPMKIAEFELTYNLLDFYTVDHAAFKNELNTGLMKLGVSQCTLATLSVALRAGSVIARVSGPTNTIEGITALSLTTVAVMGCYPTLFLVPPCNWTTDSEGVIRPAQCSEFNPINRTEDTPANASLVGCIPIKASFADAAKEQYCTAPILQPCQVPSLATIRALHYRMLFTSVSHGSRMTVECQPYAAPIDYLYPNSSWGEEWYQGLRSIRAICNDGTWNYLDYASQSARNPSILGGLICASRKQISLLRDADYYRRWTIRKLLEADAIPFRWIDTDAEYRKATLRFSQDQTIVAFENSYKGWVPSEKALQDIVNGVVNNSVIHRGIPMSQETCKNLQSYFPPDHHEMTPERLGGDAEIRIAGGIRKGEQKKVYYRAGTTPPPSRSALTFECNYIKQKDPMGVDARSGRPAVLYRDGCYCESNWLGHCPFRLTLQPTYRRFGFDTLDQKIISDSPGATTTALCWYWTDHLHPEWGYLYDSPPPSVIR